MIKYYDVDSVSFDNGVESNSTIYSDRLFQWNPTKYDYLCSAIFGDKGQYWGGRSPGKIEEFLKSYVGNPELVLCRIEQYENKSSGYPYWRFDVKI